MIWLTDKLFPRVVNVLVHPIHILGLMVLWACLLLFGDYTAFELTGGNYTNGASAVLAAIILLQQNVITKHHNELHEQHKVLHGMIESLHKKHDKMQKDMDDNGE